MLISYVPFVVVAILFSAPIGASPSLISPNVAGWSIIATLVLAYLVKVAIGDAFCHGGDALGVPAGDAGLTPDPAVTSKLEQVSDKFRTLQQRALGEQAGAALAGAEEEAAPALDAGADAL